MACHYASSQAIVIYTLYKPSEKRHLPVQEPTHTTQTTTCSLETSPFSLVILNPAHNQVYLSAPTFMFASSAKHMQGVYYSLSVTSSISPTYYFVETMLRTREIMIKISTEHFGNYDLTIMLAMDSNDRGARFLMTTKFLR